MIVTSEPAAASSKDPSTRKVAQEAGRLEAPTSLAVILDNLKLLLLGPLIAALAAFAIASFMPKYYTSVAYLSLDETGVRAADARMRSAPIVDKVLSEFSGSTDTIEARRRNAERNLRFVVAAGETTKTANLFRLEYSDQDPAVAQKINSRFIEAWLESTKPPPDRRAAIEAEIERTEAQAKAISVLVDRLQKDSPSLVAQSLQGELATPISGLVARRDRNLASVITLKNSLNGLSRDVIFGAPDLPQEPSWPKRGIITIITGAAAGLLLLMFVALHHFLNEFRYQPPIDTKWPFRLFARGQKKP